MSVTSYIIPAAYIVVSCEEGTDIRQALVDLLYVGTGWDDEETKFQVLEFDTRNIFPAVVVPNPKKSKKPGPKSKASSVELPPKQQPHYDIYNSIRLE